MYKRASLNQKFNGVAAAIFTKQAGAGESVLRNLFGKAPSASTLEAANVAMGGRAANESVVDLLARKALVNMEASRRRGALAGMQLGLAGGGLAGVTGSAAYHKGGLSNLMEALAKHDSGAVSAALKAGKNQEAVEAMGKAFSEIAAENPYTALGLGAGGAILGGASGKYLGGAAGRAVGLGRTVRNADKILSDAARVELLKQM
jgi:hypothetical protein